MVNTILYTKKLRNLTVENIITLIWFVPSYTGLEHSMGEGVTKTVIG
jgi:hypothetical protein